MNATDHSRWQDDVAAYALDALDADEARAVEAHLTDCERCRTELRWLEPSVDVLAESVAQLQPPPRLREQLIAATRDEARTAEQIGWKRGWRTWALRPVTALAATAIVAAGITGYALRGGEDDPASPAPVAFDTAPRAEGAVAVLDRQGDSGTLTVTNMPLVEGDDVYQVWIQHGDRVKPSSAFRPDPTGSVEAEIPSDLDGADAVMVTLEPERGRTKPSLPALFESDLD